MHLIPELESSENYNAVHTDPQYKSIILWVPNSEKYNKNYQNLII